jgi:hypothetical protein
MAKPKPNKPKVPKPINIDLPKSGKDVAKRLMGSSTVNGRKVNESGLAQAAVAKLVAKHGAKIVERALKAANTPAKGKTAGAARASGKQYQSKVNRFTNWEKQSSKIPSWDKDMARKSDKAFDAMKTRTKINKARNK